MAQQSIPPSTQLCTELCQAKCHVRNCPVTGPSTSQLMLWQTFAQQAGQAQASKTFEDVEVEGKKYYKRSSVIFKSKRIFLHLKHSRKLFPGEKVHFY